MKPIFLAVCALVVAGCSNTAAVVRVADRHNLTLDEATAVVGQFEARQKAALPAAPKSLEDVLEILKRDEVSGFQQGVDFAAKDGTPKGKTLQAQIELAWGEAQHILADLLDRATFNLREEYQALTRRASARQLTAKEAARRDALQKTLTDVSGLDSALQKLGDEHITQGIAVAKQVIDAAPNEYTGYRVAADYYRLREDWTQFDTAVKKLDELNPGSNGLVFARAMESIERKGDRAKAVELLNQALTKDPAFTRARAQLVLAHSSIESAYQEFQKLKTNNPNHQIVLWLGPALEAEYESFTSAADVNVDTQIRLQNLDRAR